MNVWNPHYYERRRLDQETKNQRLQLRQAKAIEKKRQESKLRLRRVVQRLMRNPL